MPSTFGTSIALARIHDYLASARTQMARIWEAARRVEETSAPLRDLKSMLALTAERPHDDPLAISMERNRRLDEAFAQSRAFTGQMLADVHFYVICWDAIEKLTPFIHEKMGFDVVKQFATVH